jgi:hypothetical protein
LGELFCIASAFTGTATQIVGAPIQINVRSIVQGGFMRIITGGTMFMFGDLGIFDTTTNALTVQNLSRIDIQGTSRIYGNGGAGAGIVVNSGCTVTYATNKPVIVGSSPGSNDASIGGVTMPWSDVPFFVLDKACGIIAV